MRYPIAVEAGDKKHAWDVMVPDLPGCFSTGDTLNGAIENIKKAMQAWLEAQIDKGGIIPQPKSMAEHQSDPDLSGWMWMEVDIDLPYQK